ncbi:MAG: Asp-tRNA(Asn)/Glu-tRNA(Gln) amidotransferase subunit GatB [Planctomycetota bacterium]
MSDYRTTIGLEVHVQLATRTKMFCGCRVAFGEAANTLVCPVCLGLPGVLPVLNREAFALGVKAAIALDCRIAPRTKFDRKHYFYPDLPKNYQISQYDMPFSSDGGLEIPLPGGGAKRVGILRAHLEEDAGKLLHDAGAHSRVDLNRTGTPLLEIVTNPDLDSPGEAYSYLETLKTLLQYLGVSDCNMEDGRLRCDANVSIAPEGAAALGTKTEVKNLNSFRAVEKALAYEAARQAKVLDGGGRVVQETRLWDPDRGVTEILRSKEEAHDYRYFPEPDLVPVTVSDAWVAEVRRSLPELPAARRARFLAEYTLSEYDCGVILADRGVADYFEALAKAVGDPKPAANWVMGEVLRVLKEKQIGIRAFPVTPGNLAKLMALLKGGTVSGPAAKEVFAAMVETGGEPGKIVKERGIAQVSDEGALAAIVEGVVGKNPAAVADFKGGKPTAVKFLVGQVMKESRGKANPRVAEKMLLDRLNRK